MSHKQPYKKGDWLVRCDVCGFRYYASECRERWDGAFVDEGCWEPKHPGDNPVPTISPSRVGITRHPSESDLELLNDDFDPTVDNWYNNGSIE